MSSISALFIVSIVSLVSSQLQTGFRFNDLDNNFGRNNHRNNPTRFNDNNYDNNVQINNFPSSPCPEIFYYYNFNNEIQGHLTVYGGVVGTIYVNITLSVAVEIFSVSFKIIFIQFHCK